MGEFGAASSLLLGQARLCGQKRRRSCSRSKDRDRETNPKLRRKRPSRWSDRPPSPPDGGGRADGDRGREAPVDRPPMDEPVVGDIYNGKVCSIMQFGCFVQLEGLRSVCSDSSLSEILTFTSATCVSSQGCTSTRSKCASFSQSFVFLLNESPKCVYMQEEKRANMKR